MRTAGRGSECQAFEYNVTEGLGEVTARQYGPDT